MTARKLYPWTALVILTTLNFLNYIDRSVLFAVQPLVQSEFQLTNTQVGYLTSAFLLFYMVAAPFVGPLADRYSRKLIIVLGAVFWSGLTLLTAVTHTYGELLLRHTLVGVGEATFVTIAPTFVADLFPENKRGRIFGIFYLAIPVGTAAGYLLGGKLGPTHGMAFSVLYRRVSRVPAGAGGVVPSRTAARPVRLAEGNSRAGNTSGTGSQPRFLGGHTGHGCGNVFPGRNPGVDADLSISRSRLQSGSGKPDLRRDRSRRWHPGIAGRRLARGPPAAAHEGLLLFCFRSQHGPGRAGHDRRIVSPRGL